METYNTHVNIHEHCYMYNKFNIEHALHCIIFKHKDMFKKNIELNVC